MKIPDPFRQLNGGVLHNADIGIAEALTGVRGKSISSRTVEPAVRAGVSRDNAVAGLHWLMIGAAGLGLAAVVGRGRR